MEQFTYTLLFVATSLISRGGGGNRILFLPGIGKKEVSLKFYVSVVRGKMLSASPALLG